MQGMIFTEFTEFSQLQSFFQSLFIFLGKIISMLTFFAFHLNQVIL